METIRAPTRLWRLILNSLTSASCRHAYARENAMLTVIRRRYPVRGRICRPLIMSVFWRSQKEGYSRSHLAARETPIPMRSLRKSLHSQKSTVSFQTLRRAASPFQKKKQNFAKSTAVRWRYPSISQIIRKRLSICSLMQE